MLSGSFPPIAAIRFDRVHGRSMTRAMSKRPLRSLLLLASPISTVAQAVAPIGMQSGSHQVHFRNDDLRAQRIARKLLGKEIAEEQDLPPGENTLWTAWVNLARGPSRQLFVMYGCSPTGNCGLYGYERSNSRWRLVLNSDAQICSILPSSHNGRRDISAYMHGSATDGTLKTYWWRRNRYVRVSERDVIFK
jgi:hypothetical protein